MELKGKKLAFLGDSITEGHGVACEENIFWKRLEQMTGAQCYGYGIGGTRIARQLHHKDPSYVDQRFSTRIDQMIPDADVVVVFGGTNDFGHGDAPMGTMNDRTEDTFYGAMHVLLQRLIEKYPAAQLVVMTPLHRCTEHEGGMNPDGLRRAGILEDYVDAVMEVAAFYAVPVLDLFRTSGLQSRVPVIRQMYVPDGLHPNDAGHEKIANRLLGFLQSL